MATLEAEGAPDRASATRATRTSAKVLRARSRALRSTSSSLFIALLWLMPTLGLFLTSLLSPGDFTSNGWWKIISKPHLATLGELRERLAQHRHPDGASHHRRDRDRRRRCCRSSSPRWPRYAFAWIDFPGRDWLFVVVIALLVVPLQMALIPVFKLYDRSASSTRSSG